MYRKKNYNLEGFRILAKGKISEKEKQNLNNLQILAKKKKQ